MRMGKFLKTAGLTLALVIGLLTGALVWVVGTEAGTRLLFSQVDSNLPSLSLHRVQGRLWSGIRIEKLAMEQQGLRVEAENIGASWRLGCLLESEFCIDYLSADALSVGIEGGSEAQGEQPSREAILLPEVNLPLGVRLGSTEVSRVEFRQRDFDASLRDVSLAGSAIGETIDLDRLRFAWAVAEFKGDFELEGSVQLVESYPLDAQLRIRTESALVSGTEWPASSLDLKLGDSLRAVDLSAVLSGVAEARLEGSVQPIAQPVGMDLLLEVGQARWPLVANPDLRVADLQFSMNGTMTELDVDAAGVIESIWTPEVDLALHGQLDPAGSLRDGMLSLKSESGELSADWGVSWFDGIELGMEASLVDANPAFWLEGVDGQLDGTVSASLRQAEEWIVDDLNLDITGELRDRPVKLVGGASALGQSVRLGERGIRLEVGDNTIHLSGAMAQQLDLLAEVNMPSLTQTLPELAGSLRGDVRVTGARDKPNLAMQLAADRVQYNGASVERLDLVGSIAAGGLEASSLNFAWRGLVAAETVRNTGSLTVDGVRGAHQFRLEVEGEPAAVLFQGDGTLVNSTWSAELRSGEVSLAGQRWQSQSDFALTVSQQGATLAEHCWQARPARICLNSPAQLAATGGASLSVERVPVEWASEYLPTGAAMSGWLDGSATASWAEDAVPDLAGSLSITELVVALPSSDGEAVDLELGSILVELQTDPSAPARAQLDLQARATGGALGESYIAVQVPIDAIADYRADVEITGLQLSSLKPMAPDLDDIAGELDVEASVIAGEGIPLVQGEVTLSDGELRGLSLPTELRDASMQIQLSGRSATLAGGWSAVESQNGAVSLQGSADWSDVPRLALRVDGESVPVQVYPLVRATIAPSLALEVSASRVRVTGAVGVPSAEIEIVPLEASVPTPSADTVIVDLAEAPAQGRAPLPELDIAIDVQLADRVYLQGFGFDSRLEGNLKVRMANAQPLQLFGDLRIEEGQYQAWGQDLVIERGELIFAGVPDDAVIDAIAWRTLPDVRAGLAISGNILAPQLQVISEPAMPDQEALSYIVVGRALGDAGDQQAAIMRAALSAGFDRSGALTNRVADGLGIQSLNVEATGSGDDTAAVVNAQLNDQLSLEYGVGVFTPLRTLTARYQLGSQMYFEAVQGVESALDFIYSFEF